MIANRQHAVVGSPDPERIVEFYSNVIGLRISDRVVDREGGLRTCFLRTDDEHHSFAVFQTAGDPPSSGSTMRANIGCTRNSSTALTNTAAT